MIKKKLVIFDFDGTLVDSMETFTDIAARVMERVHGMKFEDARKAYIDTSGLPFFQQLELILPGNKDNKRAADMFETEKLDGYFEQRVYEDAEETMLKLGKKGIKTAVSSNNFQHLVDKFMEQRGLKLDFALGFKSEEFCKGITHFKYLLKEADLQKDELLFVGDSIKDGERASDFDIDFVGKTGLFQKQDFEKHFPGVKTIDALSELIEVLQG